MFGIEIIIGTKDLILQLDTGLLSTLEKSDQSLSSPRSPHKKFGDIEKYFNFTKL